MTLLVRAERAQELADGPVEPVGGFGGTELGNRGLRTDDQLEIREHVEDHAARSARARR